MSLLCIKCTDCESITAGMTFSKYHNKLTGWGFNATTGEQQVNKLWLVVNWLAEVSVPWLRVNKLWLVVTVILIKLM